MEVKRIICLANSRKLGGRSIAGIEIDEDGKHRWIRPISEGGYGELYDVHRRYQGGAEPRVLDIIDVPVIRQKPEAFEQENWVITRIGDGPPRVEPAGPNWQPLPNSLVRSG